MTVGADGCQCRRNYNSPPYQQVTLQQLDIKFVDHVSACFIIFKVFHQVVMRQWATANLREYIVKGLTMSDEL